MAQRELQTAAAHVLHVERPSDADIDAIKTRFGFHPLDLEAVLRVPVESSFSAYGAYGFLTLLWPDPQATSSSDIRLFMNQHQLVVIGDTITHDIRTLIDTIAVATNAEYQHTATELVRDVVMHLLQAKFQLQQGSVTAHHLQSVALAIRQYGRWLQDQGLRTVVPLTILLAHRIDTVADHLRQTSTERALTAEQTPIILPRVLRTYALASALMVVVVLVTISLL